MSNKENHKIEIVSGDGSSLNISPVYEHLNIEKPRTKPNRSQKIIIPETKKTSIKKETKKK